MVKKILLTLAILAVLISAGLYYVNKVLLPVQVRGMILKAAGDALGRKVTFDTLQYSMLRGFIINDITVYSKENPDEVFIHCDNASAQVLFPALLQKKIILPSVRIDNLAVRVVRLNANAWNFSDLIAPKPAVPGAAPATPAAAADKPMDIVISGLSVNNARVKLVDLVGDDAFVEMIEPVNIRGSLDLSGSVHLTGDIKIPSTKGAITFNVHAGLKKINVKAEVGLENIITEKYLRFAPEGIAIPVKSLTVAKTNATVFYEPDNISVSGSAVLSNINAEPAPGLKARGTLTLDKISLTVKKDAIDFQGAAGLQDAALELADGQKVQADITLTQFNAVKTGADMSAKADIAVKNVIAQMSGGISVKSALSAPATALTLKQGTLEVTAHPTFSLLSAALPQGMSFTGTPALGIHAMLPPAGQGNLSYDGTIQLKDGAFKGLPTIGDISDIRGTIALVTDKATLSDLSFSALGTPVAVSGAVDHFADPILNIQAEATGIDLAIIEKVVPQIMKDNALSITGKADIVASASGPVKTIQNKGLKATISLKEANVSSDKLKQALKNINGTLTYAPPKLAWKNLSGEFQDKTYTLDGFMEDFETPLIATSLKAENMSVDAQVKKKNDVLNIESFHGTWFDSSVSATGKIFLPAGKAPTVDITATGKTSLRDIPKIMPNLAKQVEPLKLAGVLKINAHVKGNPADWQHLESTITIGSDVLNVMGYEADTITIDATQKDGELRPLEIKAKVYDGDLGVIGSVDLVKPGFPFDATYKLDGTNLEKLKRDTPLKNQQLSGALSVEGDMKGTPSDLRSLAGKAIVQIKDGYLWDIEMLSKVLSILSSSFQGGSIVIRDANATFNVSGGKVETNNLTLSSQTVSLIGEGWVDMLDQSVDLNITPRLETPQTPGGGTDLMALINPTQGLVNIHVTGTLTKPKIDHNITAPTVIKKTLQNTVGGLLKLFE
ncbi:MAG: AsmA-like C-terminal region-containing protein [Candidatus Omnitrophota bacterium]